MPALHHVTLRDLVLSSLVLFGCGTALVAEDDGPYVRDISSAFRRVVHDGYVRRVLIKPDRIVFEVHGSGMACYHAWTYVATKKGESFEPGVLAIEISPNGVGNRTKTLADDGAESLHLVCSPQKDQYLYSVLSSRDFPKKHGGDGIATNIILFDQWRQQILNLTGLNESADIYLEPVRWFQKERVVLLRQSAQHIGNRPMPTHLKVRPVCFTVPEGKERPINDFPQIAECFRRHDAIQSLVSFITKSDVGVNRTVIRSAITGKEIVYETRANSHGVLVFPLWKNVIAVGHESFGTRLVDLNQLYELQISKHKMIDYDDVSRQIVLKSTTHDENGDYNYWLMDLPQCLRHLRANVLLPE